MTHLNSLLRQLLSAPELAFTDDMDDVIPQDSLLDYLKAALVRADTFLDRRRDQVFFEVLTIPDKTTAQRVVVAYDVEYLMGLGLSLDATIELTRELIGVMTSMNVSYPATWDKLAQGILVGGEPQQVVERPVIRRKMLD